MDSATLQARIQHEVADLRALYPQIEICRATLDQWKEREETRCALQLDIRWPQHQTLISGRANDQADIAVRASFDSARHSLQVYAGK
ncbi:MAG TPA: hypothetical protein VGQ19_13525 [Burkholderiales bacterium]|jgi:hypothetical protein|nr:hypothetical protein [Burkholderiales bacterium]